MKPAQWVCRVVPTMFQSFVASGLIDISHRHDFFASDSLLQAGRD